MGDRPLLTREEEQHVLHLARSQPESAGELAEFAERLRERAAEAALGDARVRERLHGQRHMVVTADYREDKVPEADPVPRLAEIGIYDYDRDVLLVAAVDLRSGAVAELFQREGAAPPVTAGELDEAREIASNVPEMGDLLADPGSEVVAFPTPSYAFEARRGAEAHRGCVMYVGPAGGGQSRSVVVDLSARQVVPDDELPPILRARWAEERNESQRGE